MGLSKTLAQYQVQFEMKNACDDGHKMPDIGYILRGYDMYYGNPLPTGEWHFIPRFFITDIFIPTGGPVDKGFQSAIFEANYDEGITTADGRYCIPEGMDIVACSGCALSFGHEFFTGAKKYSEKLGFSLGFGANVGGGSFGASIDFQHVSEETSDYANIFIHSNAACCAYVAKSQKFAHPQFSNNFLGGLDYLPEEYGEGSEYRE